VTDHFDGKRFYNYGNQERRSYASLLRWALTRDRGPWTEVKNSPSTMPPEKEIRDRIRITHINHTTFLIQLDGINILTDPIWSERASPFSWIGPKRMRPPAFPLHELPPIHLILLSHNHYDHLDLATLKHLDLMFKPSYIVPLGVSLLLNENSIGTNITELDWWQVNPFQGLRIEGLPAHHSTARGAFDRDCTLWCGYSIESSMGKVYFAGDTGYDKETFRKIGEGSGPFRISIIPIGAYKPVWFMSPVHCTPAEALKIHHDVQSQQSIASHFGTFPLGDESQTEPRDDLHQACVEANFDLSLFVIPEAGQPLDFHESE
jgi:L-ascorbate metabolism protein UlaG (beta-lactamase superfamily)